MNKNKRKTNPDTLAAVRDQARKAANGTGIPGRYNPNRTVRFNTKRRPGPDKREW